MKVQQIFALGLVGDDTEVWIRGDLHVLAHGKYHQDCVQEYLQHEVASFVWQDDDNFYIDVKEYRVRYWLEGQNGREEYKDFDTMEEAQIFYDSLAKRAEIQKYVGEIHAYEAVVYPEFDF